MSWVRYQSCKCFFLKLSGEEMYPLFESHGKSQLSLYVKERATSMGEIFVSKDVAPHSTRSGPAGLGQ